MKITDPYPGLRVQDAIARVSGVSLKNTSRVLRALPLILGSLMDNREFDSEDYTKVLMESARDRDGPAPLDSKPDEAAIRACNQFHDDMLASGFAKVLDNVYNLKDDPYCRLSQEES